MPCCLWLSLIAFLLQGSQNHLRLLPLESGSCGVALPMKELNSRIWGRQVRKAKVRAPSEHDAAFNLNTLPNNTSSGTKLHRVGIRVAQAHPSPQGAQVWGYGSHSDKKHSWRDSTTVFSPRLACQAWFSVLLTAQDPDPWRLRGGCILSDPFLARVYRRLDSCTLS